MSTARNPEQRFTYRDYLSWPEDERWELIDGVPFSMTPAPGVPHQRVVTESLSQLVEWFRGKTCEALASPLDVLLPSDDEPDGETGTILQPDLMVVCDPRKINERRIRGGPDFVVEVLSPSTASRDQIVKAALYEKHGVREYWVLDPIERLITIRLRNERGLFSEVRFVEAKGMVPVSIFEGLKLDLDQVFSRFP